MRDGEQRIIKQAVQAELDTFLQTHAGQDAEGRRAFVRNGYQPERDVLTAVGPVSVALPKTRDRAGLGRRFCSTLLPPYLKKTRRLEAMLPWLYLKGVSTNDFDDGYAAYARYAQDRPGVTHAQCWGHTRRHVERALDSDPQAPHGLALIGDLYRQEAWIRDKRLEGPAKLAVRTRYCEPAVRAFWQWCDAQCYRLDLAPRHPLAKAVAYALERKAALEILLADPDVPIDTNHLERGLRPIPMGRRHWLFCWTEVGAVHVGIIQSLISTCRLHGVDPYTYLVDVLQRVAIHPAKRVAELTPRLWKTRFAYPPLRSDID